MTAPLDADFLCFMRGLFVLYRAMTCPETCFFWEFVVLFFKVACLVLVVVVQDFFLQAFFVLLIVALLMMIQQRVRPYTDPVLNTFETLSYATVFLIVSITLVYTHDEKLFQWLNYVSFLAVFVLWTAHFLAIVSTPRAIPPCPVKCNAPLFFCFPTAALCHFQVLSTVHPKQ